MPKIDTHKAKVNFGKKYFRKLITRVPVSFLRWILQEQITNKTVELADGSLVSALDAAKAELERRGEREDRVSITHHAIDRMSLRFLEIWQDWARMEEGIVAFMERTVYEIFDEQVNDAIVYRRPERFEACGIDWVLKLDGPTPILLTVVEYDEAKHKTQERARPKEVEFNAGQDDSVPF